MERMCSHMIENSPPRVAPLEEPKSNGVVTGLCAISLLYSFCARQPEQKIRVWPTRCLLKSRQQDTSVTATQTRYIRNFSTMKIFRLAILVFCVLTASSPIFAGQEYTLEGSATPAPEDENSHDLFTAESSYTFKSDFKESR